MQKQLALLVVSVVTAGAARARKPPPPSPSPPPPARKSPPPPSPSPPPPRGSSSSSTADPEGPSQQCRDDAGPPWDDDSEHFPRGGHYWDRDNGAAPYATPELHNDACPAAIATACAVKGTLAAHMTGPLECGGRGWFCRIMPQADWRNRDVQRGHVRDENFAHCSTPNADELDTDGHCHGSDADDTYGWWVRDHYFRGYAGSLHCCCGWDAPMRGLMNRCDFRKHVSPAELRNCRDANEEHRQSYERGCEGFAQAADPLDTPGVCWTVSHFADWNQVVGAG